MPMYNLLEYSDNYFMTFENLWNCYRDEINDDANENVNNRINNNKTITIKSFEYKTKLIRSTPDDNNILDTEVVVLLKYLNNFLRSLNFPLNNSEIIPRIPGNPDANPPLQEVPAIKTTSATFRINNAKLYVAVVTLSINDNIKFLENVKQRFKKTISWNKYRSEITT